MTLPGDVTRCLDDGCSERHECLRWICRHPYRSNRPDGDQGTRMTWAASLHPYATGESCPAKIKAPARSGSN